MKQMGIAVGILALASVAFAEGIDWTIDFGAQSVSKLERAADRVDETFQKLLQNAPASLTLPFHPSAKDPRYISIRLMLITDEDEVLRVLTDNFFSQGWIACTSVRDLSENGDIDAWVVLRMDHIGEDDAQLLATLAHEILGNIRALIANPPKEMKPYPTDVRRQKEMSAYRSELIFIDHFMKTSEFASWPPQKKQRFMEIRSEDKTVLDSL